MKMRCNIVGLIRNAAKLIPDDADEWGYVFALREFADHVESVRRGEHTIEELAELYCMTPTKAKST